jgi:hypothetical protein
MKPLLFGARAGAERCAEVVMEPAVYTAGATVISAVVNAAGTLVGKVIELYKKSDAQADEKTSQVIEKVYDTLRANLTGGCVKILKMLESGSSFYPNRLREKFYPCLMIPSELVAEFDTEFRYRMAYLRLNGVVTLIADREYGITRLGHAFLEEARRRKDYFEELFD